jgi:hypothetical protein
MSFHNGFHMGDLVSSSLLEQILFPDQHKMTRSRLFSGEILRTVVTRVTVVTVVTVMTVVAVVTVVTVVTLMTVSGSGAIAVRTVVTFFSFLGLWVCVCKLLIKECDVGVKRHISELPGARIWTGPSKFEEATFWPSNLGWPPNLETQFCNPPIWRAELGFVFQIWRPGSTKVFNHCKAHSFVSGRLMTLQIVAHPEKAQTFWRELLCPVKCMTSRSSVHVHRFGIR